MTRRGVSWIEVLALVMVVAIPVLLMLFGRNAGYVPAVILTFLFIAAERSGWRKSQQERIQRRRGRRANGRPPPAHPARYSRDDVIMTVIGVAVAIVAVLFVLRMASR